MRHRGIRQAYVMVSGLVLATGAAAQSSAFTYQGRLSQEGQPANGAYELEFALYDAADRGRQIGDTVLRAPVPVADGLFTTALDFGTEVFRGTDRWLEIAVRPYKSAERFTTLAPRQALTAVPTALYAMSAAVDTVAPPPGMALVPAGSFTMGDTLDGIDDAPPVTVAVSAFYLSRTEVPLSEWKSTLYWALDHGYDLASSLGYGKAPSHPVHDVNWHECVKWCNARSEQAGLHPVYYTDATHSVVYRTGTVNLESGAVDWSADGYRLPTEAEWERAARGGLTNQRFPWGNAIGHGAANYYGAPGAFLYDYGPDGFHSAFDDGEQPNTSPIGSFSANGFGFHDMAGNVSEWCWDWYGDYPLEPVSDPVGPDSGTSRMYRGGGYYGYAIDCRLAHRVAFPPEVREVSIGFRVARSAVP